MQGMSKGRVSEDILRVRWAAMLPVSTQRHLKALANLKLSLNDLATTADDLHDLPQGGAHVMAAGSPSTGAFHTAARSFESQLNKMRADIDRLTLTLSSVLQNWSQQQHAVQSFHQSRSQQQQQQRGARSRSRSSSRTRPENWNGNCYYHQKFGAMAQRCEEPCTYKQGQRPKA